MSEERCIYCNEIIPEGRQVCWSCEQDIMKVGTILQSYGATAEEVSKAYNSLNIQKKEGE